jgi:MFS transporter, DHA2 family, multidrug resistance protein
VTSPEATAATATHEPIPSHAIACILKAHFSAWSGSNFIASQIVLAVRLAFACNALVGSILLDLINAGGLARPMDTLTFAGFFQAVCLFGRQIGSALLLYFIPIREQFHSSVLGLGVQLGESAPRHRLLGLGAAVAQHTTDKAAASGRAGEILGFQLCQQAFTLAITNRFTLVAWAAVLCLVVVACSERVPTQYSQFVTASAPTA